MISRVNIREYEQLIAKPKRSKYGSVPMIIDGIRFHSKGEARRYQELKLLERAGHITSLDRQFSFNLHVMNQHGSLVRIGSYVADFSYAERNGPWIVEDFKGFMTPLAKWKLAHFEAEYGIKVRITTSPKRRRAA